jgi:hypothetical protein
MVYDPKEPEISQSPRLAAERRTHPRYGFTAEVEVIEAETSARIEARIGDLSQRGCHVESDRPFSLGTAVKVQITKDRITFALRLGLFLPRLRVWAWHFQKWARSNVRFLKCG